MTYSKLCFPHIRVWALAAEACFLLKCNRTVRVRWLPSVADCNRSWGEGPCPQATSAAVFLLANAPKHKLEICQGWASRGTRLLPKNASAKVVPGTLATPRPPPQVHVWLLPWPQCLPSSQQAEVWAAALRWAVSRLGSSGFLVMSSRRCLFRCSHCPLKTF